MAAWTPQAWLNPHVGAAHGRDKLLGPMMVAAMGRSYATFQANARPSHPQRSVLLEKTLIHSCHGYHIV